MNALSEVLWLEAVVAGLFASFIGVVIGRLARNRAGAGFCLGLLLGPLGWVLILLIEDHRRKCPECRKPIDPAAKRCPFCQSSLVRYMPEDAPPTAPLDEWFYRGATGQLLGPVSRESLKAKLEQGEITGATEVRAKGAGCEFAHVRDVLR